MALTDLTGTKWRLNEYRNLNIPRGSIVFHLNFSSNDQNYSSMTVENLQGKAIEYDNTVVVNNATESWTDEAYRLIEINGGTDATNSDAIDFVQANGEQIIVDTGVKLLKSGTSVIGKINGHYVSSVNGTNVMSGIVANTPTGYDVTITFSNCRSYKNPYLIFDTETVEDINRYYSSTNQIGSLSSADGTVNVTTATGKIYVVAGGVGGFIDYGTITCSNGIREDRQTTLANNNFVLIDGQPYGGGGGYMTMISEYSISSDGTITIDGYDWDD